MWNEKRVFSRYEALTDLYQTADYNSRSLTVSFRTLADRWRWCLAKVQRFIKSLSDEGYIKISKGEGVTIFTICDTPSDTLNDTPNDTPSDTPTDTLSRAYKNDNIISCLNEELKEDIPPLYSPQGETKKTSKFVKPTIEEIEAYCQQKGYKLDAEYFFNFYESKGWKVGNTPMKSWKSAIVTWTKRNNNNYGNSRPNYQNNGHPSDNEMVGIALDVIEEFKAKRRNSG